MDPLIPPLFRTCAIQRGMRRPAERPPPTPAHQSLADEIIDTHEVPRRERGGDNLPNFLGKLRGHPLVGIDFENPVAAAGVDPGMPARPLALPGALDQAIGKASRYLARAVTTAIKHDDDLVGKTHTGKAIGELTLFVPDDNDGRKPHSVHAAALATRSHNWHEAASAAATESPSIKVPVVR